MMKSLLLTTLLLAAPGAALAGTSPSPAPTMVQFDVAITVGTDVRTYKMSSAVGTCARVEIRGGDREDTVELCPRAAADKFRVGVSWRVKASPNEYVASHEVVVARGGTMSSGPAGANQGPMFTLKLT